MNKDLDHIYIEISAMMVKGMDSSWTEAVLEVELHALAIKLSGGYLHGLGHEPLSFTFSKDDKKQLIDLLLELHFQTAEGQENRWNTLNYHLYPDGRYSVDFEWNQQLADDIEKVCAAS